METRVEAAELRHCPLFAGLPDGDLAAAAKHAQRSTTAAHTDIFVEGERCDGLWILASGRAKLYHTSTEGRQHVVSFHAPGSTLELGPALDGRPFSVSANAPDGATLVFLPRAALHVVSRQPGMVRSIIDQLCLELRQLDIAAAIAALKDARGRIYCTLLRLAQQFGESASSNQVRIQYRLTRQDIADVAGVTLETAIRILSELTREGLIQTDSRLIAIEDAGLLRQMALCGECQLSCSFAGTPGGPTVSATPQRERQAVRMSVQPSKGNAPAPRFRQVPVSRVKITR